MMCNMRSVVQVGRSRPIQLYDLFPITTISFKQCSRSLACRVVLLRQRGFFLIRLASGLQNWTDVWGERLKKARAWEVHQLRRIQLAKGLVDALNIAARQNIITVVLATFVLCGSRFEVVPGSERRADDVVSFHGGGDAAVLTAQQIFVTAVLVQFLQLSAHFLVWSLKEWAEMRPSLCRLLQFFRDHPHVEVGDVERSGRADLARDGGRLSQHGSESAGGPGAGPGVVLTTSVSSVGISEDARTTSRLGVVENSGVFTCGYHSKRTAASSDEPEQQDDRRTSQEQTGFELKVPGRTLQNVRRGEIVAICGRIGSGKSTLLRTLATPRTPLMLSHDDGDSSAASSTILYDSAAARAYVAQKPFLLNGTIRENVVFFKPSLLEDAAGSSKNLDAAFHRLLTAPQFPDPLYQAVLEACMLNPDLDRFPERDLTKVGESGVQLSGGQQARVCLARALYQQAAILLLDDVLSAVDASTGRQIWDRCVRGAVSGLWGSGVPSAVILATHQLHYLETVGSGVTRILLLERGLANLVPVGRAGEGVRSIRDRLRGSDEETEQRSSGARSGNAVDPITIPEASVVFLPRAATAPPRQEHLYPQPSPISSSSPPMQRAATYRGHNHSFRRQQSAGSAERGPSRSSDISIAHKVRVALLRGGESAPSSSMPEFPSATGVGLSPFSGSLPQVDDELLLLSSRSSVQRSGAGGGLRSGDCSGVYSTASAAGEHSDDEDEGLDLATQQMLLERSVSVPPHQERSARRSAFEEQRLSSRTSSVRTAGSPVVSPPPKVRTTGAPPEPQESESTGLHQVYLDESISSMKTTLRALSGQPVSNDLIDQITDTLRGRSALERRGKGEVNRHHVYFYVRIFFGSPLCNLLLVCCLSLSSVLAVVGTVILQRWADAADDPDLTQAERKETNLYYLKWFALAQLARGLEAFGRALAISLSGLRASLEIHDRMLSRLLIARMRFFDQTPTGLLTNRFFKDLGQIDQSVPDNLYRQIERCINMASRLVLIVAYVPALLFAVPLFMLPVRKVFSLSRGPMRDMRRY